MQIPETLNRLVRLLGKLPGVGEKTATRFAFYLLDEPLEFSQELARVLLALKENVRLCSRCFNLTEHERCRICDDMRRQNGAICVVETIPDLVAIERTGEFDGTYHVLHGAISPLSGVGPNDLKIRELLERVRTEEVRELILATNINVDGEATALYLKKLLGTLDLAVTRIASGVPLGGDLEHIDKGTLGRALANRRPL